MDLSVIWVKFIFVQCTIIFFQNSGAF